MSRLAWIALATLALASPGLAQPMDPAMPGMTMPMHPAKARVKRPRRGPRATARATGSTSLPASAQTPLPPDPAADHAMAGMPGMQMAPAKAAPASRASTPQAMANMPGMTGMAMGTDEPTEPEIPRGPPPQPATDYAADRVYGREAMAAARNQLREEHGGSTVSMVMVNLAEYQSAPAGGGYRWDGEAWVGGDIDRFVVKSEGDGSGRNGPGEAEAQALYARAIGPYFDLQAGIRQDFSPGARSYATIGFQGLAPFWIDVSGALFLSTKGELLGRLESSYDLRLTQKWILQPRAELNFAARSTVAAQTGAGLDAELGLRLRYEIKRQFAPYIGVSWDGKIGTTAGLARAEGDDAGGATFVAGIRAWL